LKRSLTHSFLEALRDTVNDLNHEASLKSFNPTITLLSALILTATASFSTGVKLPTLILLLSVALTLYARPSTYAWVKVVLIVALWALLVSIPLAFITSGEIIASLPLGFATLRVSREGVNTLLAFTLRATSAAAIFTAFYQIIGWRGMVKGLRGLRVPSELTAMASLSITYIPLFLREAVRLLSAREARIMKKGRLRRVWWMLTTVIGDLMLKGYERAWRLEKALRAKSFVETSPRSAPLSSWRPLKAPDRLKDLGLMGLALFIPVLNLLIGP